MKKIISAIFLAVVLTVGLSLPAQGADGKIFATASKTTWEFNWYTISASSKEVARVTGECKIIKSIDKIGPTILSELEKWKNICLELKEIEEQR